MTFETEIGVNIFVVAVEVTSFWCHGHSYKNVWINNFGRLIKKRRGGSSYHDID